MIENENTDSRIADDTAESPESQPDEALDAFIEANADKIKNFFRGLLVAWERDESVQASTAQLRGTKSEEEPPESVEKEPEEPIGRRGKPVVGWRNGRCLDVGA